MANGRTPRGRAVGDRARWHNAAMAKTEWRGPKLSEALLEFAQPLLRLFGGTDKREEFEAALRLAMLVWNACALQRAGKGTGLLELVLQAMERQGTPPQLVSCLRDMGVRYLTRREFDARVMAEVEAFLGPDGDPRVRVHGANVAELSENSLRSMVKSFTDLAPRAARPAAGVSAKPSEHLRPKRTRAQRTSAEASSGDSWLTKSFAAAQRVHEIQPWEWLLDRDVFGVRVADDVETYWCSVMGAGGEFYGIGVYRGDAAFAVFRAIQDGSDPYAGMCGFDGFLFSFVDRDELDAQGLKRAKDSGLKFRGRAAWPQLEEVRHGRLPRHFGEERAPRATALLATILEGALAMKDSQLRESVDLDGELPVFELQGNVLRSSFARPIPPRAKDYPSVDQLAVARAAKLPRANEPFEFDVFAIPARVADDEGWEYAPVLFMAAGAHTGRPLPPEAGAPELRLESCARNLLAVFGGIGLLPAELHVQRQWIFDALKPTAQALDLKLELREHLAVIERLSNALPMG